MKLIVAVVQNEDANDVVDALLEAEFRTTRLASTGGFLRRGASDEPTAMTTFNRGRRAAQSKNAARNTASNPRPSVKPRCP